MEFFCINCKANIEPRYKACPFCGEPITDFLRNYLSTPIDGKYQIISRLGVGGMGEVYKVLHVHLNSIRVIKLMRAAISDQEGANERFVREARLATRIQSPYVAALYDFSTMLDDTYYMVWEFIEGTNLLEVMRAHGSLSPRYAALLAIQTLLGLDAIHRVGVVHRDISPENLMITKDEEGQERVKVIDLGIAKSSGESMDEKTKTGIFVGKWKYCSPEHLGMLREGERIDGRADLYSFGIVLYEMLSGVPPFVADTPHRYLMLHATETPRAIHEVNPGAHVPAELEAVVFRALEKDRNKRFATAREFARALEALLPSLGDEAPIETHAFPKARIEPTELRSEPTPGLVRPITERSPAPAAAPDATVIDTARSQFKPAPPRDDRTQIDLSTRASEDEGPAPTPSPGDLQMPKRTTADRAMSDTGELSIASISKPVLHADPPVPAAPPPPAAPPLEIPSQPLAGSGPLDRVLSERAREEAGASDQARSMLQTLHGEPALGEKQDPSAGRGLSPLDATLMSEKVPASAAGNQFAQAQFVEAPAATGAPANSRAADSKPVAAVLKAEPPAPVAVEEKSRGWLVWAVIAIVLLVVGVVGYRVLVKPKAFDETVVVDAPTGGAEPAGAVTMGRLGINAFPWGEVVSVKDTGSGKLIEIAQNLQTPTGVDVPAGNYEVTVRHPRRGTKTEKVTVDAGVDAVVMISFESPDADLPFVENRK